MIRFGLVLSTRYMCREGASIDLVYLRLFELPPVMMLLKRYIVIEVLFDHDRSKSSFVDFLDVTLAFVSGKRILFMFSVLYLFLYGER